MTQDLNMLQETEIGLIPNDWRVAELSQIANFVVRGFSYKGIEKSKIKGDYLFITLNSVMEGGGFKKEYSYVSSDKIAERHFVIQGDIVIANTEQTKTGTLLGCPALVEFPCGYNKQKGVFSHHITKVIPKSEIDKIFLYYYLIYNQKNAVKYNTGSVIWALDVNSWSKEKIAVPPLQEQQHIAKMLSDFDEKIELNKQMNKTLEAIGQALFKHWFIDFEFPDEHGKPYRSSGGKMVDSELGQIPEGWQVKKVGEILELSYGKALKENERNEGIVPVYGSNGIIGWHDEYLVKGPGIIVGRKGNPGTIVWSNTNFVAIDTAFYVSLKINSVSLPYVYYALQAQHLSLLSAHSAVPGLNRNIAYMNLIAVPDSQVLSKFNVFFNTLTRKIQNNQEEISILVKLRDMLLPKLMSGKIRVPVSNEASGSA